MNIKKKFFGFFFITFFVIRPLSATLDDDNLGTRKVLIISSPKSQELITLQTLLEKASTMEKKYMKTHSWSVFSYCYKSKSLPSNLKNIQKNIKKIAPQREASPQQATGHLNSRINQFVPSL